MAYTIPTLEPTSIIAGTTVKWTKALGDYPASTWTLTYQFKGAGSFSVTATADGNGHSVSIAYGTTNDYPVGNYWWQSYVSDGTNRYLVESGKCEVVKDLADATEGHDGRSHARIVLEAIEAVIEGKATRDQSEISIGDRTLKRLSPKQLIDWRATYRAEVNAEDAEMRRKLGKNTQNSIYARFTSA